MKVSKYLILVLGLLSALALAACGGSASGASNAQKVTITTQDTFKYDPATLTAKVGQPVEVTLDNRGNLEHSFVIDALGVKIGPITGGQKGSGSFTPSQAGTYTFYCSVPGHIDAGMTGTLTVNP